mmetsp:Transcript_49113/g.72968  ORF Transcript_49113/g.72968 Transcript_49113/m.72968 type:complete len:396 (+) Transcript_49113:3-1190(+)
MRNKLPREIETMSSFRLPVLITCSLLFHTVDSFSPTLFSGIRCGTNSLCIVRPGFSLLRAGPRDDPTSAGPRGERRSTRRRTSSSTRPSRASSTSRPRRSAPVPNTPIKRAPHQFDHTKEKARSFIDGKSEIIGQISNEDAPPFTLPDDVTPEGTDGEIITHEHVSTYGLDDLFPNLDFSLKFCSNRELRSKIRSAMREDVFDSTESYANLPKKARSMLLLPDSSLQGSWRCADDADKPARMTQLTKVLEEYLGKEAPSGDEFMETIGALCGSHPSTHWIDIVGVLDRRIPHSWHQDTGRCPEQNSKTVLLGFPPEDEYEGVGVFSHVVKLKRERLAMDDHPSSEPVVFASLDVGEEYVMRPRFGRGREIIVYRDVDVLHSSPDVAYRDSVMRFM